VFREVAQAHASYFSGLDAATLADAIRHWLAQQQAGAAPASAGMQRLSWLENTARLLTLLDDAGH
jgi:dTDP-4-dehydrorhamnose reductase